MIIMKMMMKDLVNDKGMFMLTPPILMTTCMNKTYIDGSYQRGTSGKYVFL